MAKRRVLFDVNVLIDALLKRQPHASHAEQLWGKVERREIKGFVPAHGVTTIFYLFRKQLGSKQAKRAVELLLHVFEVAPVNGRVLAAALTLACPDFEDSVCAAAGQASRCQMIITRDPAGFFGSVVPVFEPEVALVTMARAKSIKRAP
jgi:predicted nucleic acid-binding protein